MILDYVIPGVVALIVSIVSALATVYAVRLNSRVDNKKNISDTALEMFDRVKADNVELKKELEALKARVVVLEKENKRVQDENKELLEVAECVKNDNEILRESNEHIRDDNKALRRRVAELESAA